MKRPVEYIIFIGHGVSDLLVGTIAFIKVKPYRYFAFKYVKYDKFKEFFITNKKKIVLLLSHTL